jgi:pimeloyl-ACP methyl ester carboxylesterase
VSRLVAAGWAVVAVDHRGFGGSTREVSGPEGLNAIEKRDLYLDLCEAIDAVGGRAGVDTSRVVLAGTGLSVNAAVECASRRPAVRGLVLLGGLIEGPEEDFLLSHPDLPMLLVVAAGDRKGADLARQYAARLTGAAQRYYELAPPDPAVPGDWVGTDGLAADTGLAEAILWFLEGLPEAPAPR